MSEKTENRVALITGAARGIGATIALALAAEGTDIAVVDYGEKSAAEETLAKIAERGVRVAYYRCDVSDFAAAKATADAVFKDFGKIDILVNNAGVTADKLLVRMEEADWDRVININLKGCFNMIKHVTPYMMRKRYGRIVSISSVVGLMGNAGQANYSASKAGIIGLTKTVAKEFAPRGVTANAVAPGFIKTAMTDALSEEQKQAMYKLIPLGKLGETEDIAEAVLFLVSDRARYITGEVLRVDGGMCM
ncbi:3-oxoacyl-[acyl-carrier-protein] reductase [Candidatus Borkfalkia ceftriaxoniphila]|jgi:3-oxoacyl-[acyl-carrier-protein] reductase|uniref:3-oxoacyl-[acyl-carrier-protein] reductase n=1 Tax=Candidatus Borkfalkia ceftriaxoniphila TaxID=2508949 RepID=A0A4Q2KA23_9FIRM|nr:3-oxoacyl-[acyl-carrier-protein] reductase [Candidatus Borkfalkia ceftriaxoniphila]RXZ61478.1 3-oxoacyl-[acyl-carrier-protein] reductase [Candidatus Borkfalkia ceftriaxoniphila]